MRNHDDHQHDDPDNHHDTPDDNHNNPDDNHNTPYDDDPNNDDDVHNRSALPLWQLLHVYVYRPERDTVWLTVRRGERLPIR